MELAGSVEIAAPRAALWAALNDPDVLARCIDGVETLTRQEGETPSFDGVMNAKVGPVRAKFAGTVRLEDIVAPERYRLVGEGKGGVAGFARGSADIALAELGPAATRLDYVVKAQVGGKLAQLGARLIEGTAKQYADHFFTRLQAEVEGAAPAPETAAPPADPAPEPATAEPAAAGGGIPPLLWGTLLIIATLGFLWWQWQ
jgi:carbon monoxide dehydrogenase subunit G